MPVTAKPSFHLPELSVRSWVLLIGLTVFSLFSYQIFLPWFPTYDSGVYLELARSLARGEGYRYMGYVHNKYPPMFPLLLSPFYRFSQNPIAAIRFFLVLITAAAVSLVFLLFREEESPGRGLIAALWFSLTAPLIYHSALVLSDLTYLAFSLFSFVMLKGWRKTGNRKYLLGLGIGLGLTALTRIIGFVLPVAVWLGSRLKKSREKKSERSVRKLALAALVLISLWQIRSLLVPQSEILPVKVGDSNDYFNELLVKNRLKPDRPMVEWSELLRRLGANSKLNAKIVIPEGVGWSHFGNFDLIFLLLMLAGFGAKAKKVREEEIYIALYMFILLSWPTPQGTRFIMPIVPFLINYLINGIMKLTGFLRKFEPANRKRRMIVWAVPIAAGVIYGYFLVHDAWITHRWNAKGGYSDYNDRFYFRQSMLWAKRKLPRNTVLMSDRASWSYHISGLKTYAVRTADIKELLEIIYKYEIGYLITSRVTGYGKPLRKMVKDYPNLFKPVIGNRWSGVYSVSGIDISGIGDSIAESRPITGEIK